MTNASCEAKLAAYAALLRKWNPAINLVSPATLHDVESRHIADSRQLADLAPAGTGLWLDLGSGGGLPGLVVAICRAQPVQLVDSDARKVAFLQTAIRELDLPNCTAVHRRIEDLPPAAAATITARALAPLVRLVPYLDLHLAQGGTAWLMKGRNWQGELDALGRLRNYRVTPHPSQTDPDAAILQFDRVSHD